MSADASGADGKHCVPVSRWNVEAVASAIERKVWTASRTVRRYLHQLASGDPDCDWPTYIRATHMPATVDRMLILGCGTGWLERALFQKGGIGSIVACDNADSAVARARDLAAGEHLQIDYAVVDLDREPLPAGEYDVIIANDVLHHLTYLESLYTKVQKALRPDGKFIFSEYVGPNRFQYSDSQMNIINRYMKLIPDRLRYDPCLGITLRQKERISIERMLADDPTEAVRSEDVLPLARAMFKTEAEYPYGGSLLSPLLYEIIVNFNEDDAKDSTLLQVLCDAEDRLIRAGQLDPDFMIFVGAPAVRFG